MSWQTTEPMDYQTETEIFADALSTDIHSKTELLGDLIYTFPDYEVWVIKDIAKFINSVESYNFNQELNSEHVANLAKRIIETKLVIGNLSTCEFNNGKNILIDGHHRLDALKLVLRETSASFVNAIPLIIFNYRSDEPNSKRTMELFHKINTVKPYTVIKTIDEDCLYIINTLKTKCPGFKDGIRDTNKSRTAFPYVHQSQFKCELEKLLKQLVKYNRDSIISQINEYNMQMRTLAESTFGFKELFKLDSVIKTETVSKKLDSMKKIGFYLASKKGADWYLKIKAMN
jgi:hypothetical protein